MQAGRTALAIDYILLQLILHAPVNRFCNAGVVGGKSACLRYPFRVRRWQQIAMHVYGAAHFLNP